MLDNTKQGAEVTIESLVSNEGRTMITDLIRWETGRWIDETEMGGYERVNRQGKIAKRIRANMRKMHGIKLDNKTIEQIGNIANENSLKEGIYTIEWTDDMESIVGRFGDSQSCFQEGHENYHHLLAMDDSNKFGAICIYDEDGNKLARAWTFTDPKDGGTAIWNAYGITLYKIALIASKAEKTDWRKVEIHGDIWINHHDVYAIGGEAINYYFGVNPSEYDNCSQCYNCSCNLYDDYYTDNDGDRWCESCHGEYFFYCDDCDNYHHQDSQNEVSVTTRAGYTQHVCGICADNNYYECYACENHFADIGHFDDGNLCRDCQTDYEFCENCRQPIWDDNATFADDDATIAYCSYCVENYTCIECGDVHETLTSLHHHGNLCDDCADDLSHCEECGEHCPAGTLANRLCLTCEDGRIERAEFKTMLGTTLDEIAENLQHSTIS